MYTYLYNTISIYYIYMTCLYIYIIFQSSNDILHFPDHWYHYFYFYRFTIKIIHLDFADLALKQQHLSLQSPL